MTAVRVDFTGGEKVRVGTHSSAWLRDDQALIEVGNVSLHLPIPLAVKVRDALVAYLNGQNPEAPR